MKKLAVLSKNKVVEFVKDLTPDDELTISNHVRNLIEFDIQSQKFNSFKFSIEDFKKLLLKNKHDIDFNRPILEIASTFRAFLDHWETEIKRRFGKDSNELKVFKKATIIEYDKSFSYRFFYSFRNYVQHVRMPSFQMHSCLNESNRLEMKIAVNKKELIDTFKDWKPILLEDFAKEPDSIDLVPLVDELYSSVKRVNLVAINLLDIVTIYNSSLFLLKLTNIKPGAKGDLILTEFEKTPGSQIKLSFLPISTAEFIIKNARINKK